MRYQQIWFSEAFKEGVEAFKAGLKANPYQNRNPIMKNGWASGYWNAMKGYVK